MYVLKPGFLMPGHTYDHTVLSLLLLLLLYYYYYYYCTDYQAIKLGHSSGIEGGIEVNYSDFLKP